MLRSHNHRFCPSFLVAALIFSVFTLTGIVSAAWVDAPNAPPNYGTPGCSPQPCEEDDFRPLNLSSTAQTKQGSIAASGFYDTQDPTQMYALDPASPIFSLNLAGHAVINATTTDVGAQLVVNNPRANLKVGSIGDAIYTYANSSGAALFAEQENPVGYAIYASGTTSYFNTNVEVGSAANPKQLCLSGVCQSTWPSAGTGTTNRITKWTAPNVIGDSVITDDGTTVTVGGNLSVTGTANTCKKIPYDGLYNTENALFGGVYPTSTTSCGANYYLIGAIDASGYFGNPSTPPQAGSLLCCKNAD